MHVRSSRVVCSPGSPKGQHTTKIQREDPQERHKEERKWDGRGEENSEILGCPADGGLAQGGPNTQQHTTTITTTTRNPEEVEPEGPQCSGFWSLGFGLFGLRKFDPKTKTLKLAKVGHDRKMSSHVLGVGRMRLTEKLVTTPHTCELLVQRQSSQCTWAPLPRPHSPHLASRICEPDPWRVRRLPKKQKQCSMVPQSKSRCENGSALRYGVNTSTVFSNPITQSKTLEHLEVSDAKAFCC